MDGNPAARLRPPFVESGYEPNRAQRDAWKPNLSQCPPKLMGVNEGSADQLKGERRSAALGKVCAVQQDLAGIKERGFESRHVRRRSDPAPAGVRPQHAPPPALHGDNVQLRTDSLFGI